MDVINGISGDALTAYQLDSRIKKVEADQKKVEADHDELKLLLTKVLIGVGPVFAVFVGFWVRLMFFD